MNDNRYPVETVPVRHTRTNLSRHIKSHVWAMTYGRCWYCGWTLNPFENFVIEHVLPLCRGGSNDISNLVPACSPCNESKGRRTLEEWRGQHADEHGLGPDPARWLYWFEEQEPYSPHGQNYRKRDVWEWREMAIRGYRVYEDERDGA